MYQMIFLHTAKRRFDESYRKDGHTWDDYIKWSKLNHLTEVVSLDGILNEDLVERDPGDPDYWNFIYVDGQCLTDFFTSLEYVLQKTKTVEEFNLLTVVVNPTQDCKGILLHDYEFMGYDLLDRDYCNSALTNCGGFDETFLPADLNQFGLIDDYEKAHSMKRRLLKNNPESYNADTNVIAVWRHKTIGRTKSNR
jgi:hypothetical protein